MSFTFRDHLQNDWEKLLQLISFVLNAYVVSKGIRESLSYTEVCLGLYSASVKFLKGPALFWKTVIGNRTSYSLQITPIKIPLFCVLSVFLILPIIM